MQKVHYPAGNGKLNGNVLIEAGSQIKSGGRRTLF